MKAALLDQRVVAGLGNIYVSRGAPPRPHPARPPRRRSWSSSPARRQAARGPRRRRPRRSSPRRSRPAARPCAISATPTARSGYFQHRFAVYDREGEPCPTPGCTGTIKRIVQSGRSTYLLSGVPEALAPAPGIQLTPRALRHYRPAQLGGPIAADFISYSGRSLAHARAARPPKRTAWPIPARRRRPPARSRPAPKSTSRAARACAPSSARSRRRSPPATTRWPMEALKAAEPEIARAAQKGIVHANVAARKVSRLNQPREGPQGLIAAH